MKFCAVVIIFSFLIVKAHSQDLLPSDFMITIPEFEVLDTNLIHDFNNISFCFVSAYEDSEEEIFIKVLNSSNGELLSSFHFNLNSIRTADLNNPVWTLLPNLRLSNNCIFELSLGSSPNQVLCRKTYFNLLVP